MIATEWWETDRKMMKEKLNCEKGLAHINLEEICFLRKEPLAST